jgi:uncharacterized protein YgbK (DUF1537 family)
MESLPISVLSCYKPTKNLSETKQKLQKELAALKRKIVVLDDDPTGIQTVSGVSVFTDWSVESLCEGLLSEDSLFFVLTNSRSFIETETIRIHQEIARNLARASEETGRDYLVLSRGDSTLRGHYPLETETLRQGLQRDFDGEILIPFFLEGGRYTINDIQYVKEKDQLVPAGETEFAQDKTFGYSNSNLAAWIEEKSQKQYLASSVVSIGLEELRNGEIEKITKKLTSITGFNKIIVNALDYPDLEVFTLALCRALSEGKHYLFRCAASFVKVLGSNPSRPLLCREELVGPTPHGGILLVGSHVKKTTVQLAYLHKTNQDLQWVEFNQHLALETNGLEKEQNRVRSLVEGYLEKGENVVVHTRRDRLDIPDSSEQEQLLLATKISDSLVGVIGDLTVRPAFVIAKGGITSSDVGTKALRVRKASVLGQIEKGIPVWKTGEESKFPGLSYIIFPGNVGEENTLARIFDTLTKPASC